MWTSVMCAIRHCHVICNIRVLFCVYMCVLTTHVNNGNRNRVDIDAVRYPMVADEPPEKQQRLEIALLNGSPPAGTGSSDICATPPPRPWTMPIDVGSALTPMGGGGGGRDALFPQRKQREFIPDSKKDDSYWDRRRRNNEAAKRSREKRRLNDMVLETRVLELVKENSMLRAELNAIREKYGLGPAMLPAQLPHGLSQLLQGPHPHGTPHPPPPHASPPLPDPVTAIPQRTVIHQPIPLHHPHLQRPLPSPAAPLAAPGIPTSNAKLITALSMPKALLQPVYSPAPHPPNHPHTLTPLPHPAEEPHHNSSRGEESSPLSSGSWASAEDQPTGALTPSAGTAFSLPHKLRHKWLISGSDASTSPEQREREDGVSSDGDSGASSTDVPASPPRPAKSRRRVIVSVNGQTNLKSENIQLRSEMQRLAEEVATLRDIMLHPGPGGTFAGKGAPAEAPVSPPSTPAEPEDLRKVGESSPSSCGNSSGSEH
ncbi:pollen-specific leucine-rich repeat extensin-like protein 2 isoform X2 [Varroa jacobsoni]|uniref:pollen-specific leucine-rich repeat extensin-like protein 2 isoform X2 n=1 Tax=Varroa jacobsoni TaxID=62625 RepID=UPI000BF77A0C|nr:pollen-specific leucine-rich repeat extensin-like protein 2 isoform X2 [Varroa jacobsoni]